MDAAARLGAEVVVACDAPQAMSQAMGQRALVVDLDRPDQTADAVAQLARRLPLDAVVALDDQGVLAAAEAAARLGLAHSPPSAVAATRDKHLLRHRLAAAGLPQPAHRLLRPGDDPQEAASRVGLPAVAKPLGLSASRGVIRADSPAGLAEAANRSRAVAGQAEVLVESFVPGPEVAVEGLLVRGRFQALAVFDKPDPLDGPLFEETIYTTPTRLPPAQADRAVSAAASACAALGLVEGPAHAELRLGPDPVVIDLAARTIGGRCSSALAFRGGRSLEEVVLAAALGRRPDTRLAPGAFGAMMIPIPAAGVLVGVEGQEQALAVPGVTGVEVTAPPGRPIRPLPEGDRYLGFIFARLPDPAAVEAALREAHSRLRVQLADAPARVGCR